MSLALVYIFPLPQLKAKENNRQKLSSNSKMSNLRTVVGNNSFSIVLPLRVVYIGSYCMLSSNIDLNFNGDIISSHSN